MPKDTKKNRYFQIGIAWDSWTLAQLEADAKLHQMDDQPAKLIAVRLTEYYRLAEKGIIVPGVTAMMAQSPQQQGGSVQSNGNSKDGMPPSPRDSAIATTAGLSPEPEEQTGTVTESEHADENADAALDFYAMDEDE